MPSPLLTRRAVVQAAVETTYGTPAALGVGDGVLVSDPNPTVKPNVLTRDFTRDTLSQQAFIIGRKLGGMEFTTELRGNGKQNSGLLADAPIISRLFRACGYALTATAVAAITPVYEVGDHPNPVSWTSSAATGTQTDLISYTITCDTGGASGAAKVTITSDTAGEGSASAIVTSGTQISLGTKGNKVTPTWAGNLTIGQTWQVWATPAGLWLKPVSDNFESVTLAMYKDGVKHLLPGAFGTFDITATADQAMPTPTYEKTLPSQVELARLRVDSYPAVVEKFTFTQGNDVQPRPDVGSADGYIGIRIVARKPVGGIDPEATHVVDNDFWSKLSSARRMPLQMRVGTKAGNTVWMLFPSAQYTGLTYKDRNGISTYDAGLQFAGYTSDDEAQFFLM
jgi:hypothetical protein